MELRAIAQHDFPEWKALRQALYNELKDADNDSEVQKIFASHDWHCWFVIDKQGNIIGLVELAARNIVDGCLSSPVAYLEGLYLKPGYRSKGIGKQIIKFILSWCAKNGYSELATDTELANTRAQHFYESTGFEETDRIVQYRIEI
jgi:aminoglycoside 6'-N-acetyltransferase I